MKDYIEFKTKISKSGGTSSSAKTTIPKEILQKMEVTSGDNIRWRVYDNNNKVEILFEKKETPESIPFINEDLQRKQQIRQQQRVTKENHKKYIKGNKKEGYYIVNEEKQLNIGAYLKKDDARYDVDNLINKKWNKESIEICKLNVEYYITEERYPHIRNNNFYYCLTEEEYNKMKEDVYNNTPFKNISYEELQRIIHDSIHYEELPDDTKEPTPKTKKASVNIDETTQKPQKKSNKEILSTTTTENNKYTINLQKNPHLQIAIIDNTTQRQLTTLGASKRENSQIQSIITQLQQLNSGEEMKELLKQYR